VWGDLRESGGRRLRQPGHGPDLARQPRVHARIHEVVEQPGLAVRGNTGIVWSDVRPASWKQHRKGTTMGFKQTPTHRNGKGSYHQIGLVRGQFGNVPMDKWLSFIKDTGFDGWEEASWELDLRKCDTDAGAAAYAKERVALAQKHGLEIFTVAV